MRALPPAARAFETIAKTFDINFGAWQSVAAQRRAVRSALLREFPEYGRILEIGGGTGEDATFLAKRGFEIVLTDPSPGMVSIAAKKLAPLGSSAIIVSGEDLGIFADRYLSIDGRLFDGAFSNFAPMNCITNLQPAARGLARLLRTDAVAIMVVFGTFCPGEIVTEMLRGRPLNTFRRFRRGPSPARLGGRNFSVVYHRRKDLIQGFSPWFVLERRLGIGIAVPPSAAEPWISNHKRLLNTMEAIDNLLAGPLATLGDHVLYQFRRTSAAA